MGWMLKIPPNFSFASGLGCELDSRTEDRGRCPSAVCSKETQHDGGGAWRRKKEEVVTPS